HNMRCQLIRLHWVRISMREPFRISNGEVAARDAILIEIHTDAGIGWGEAAPMPGLRLRAFQPCCWHQASVAAYW
ncbi:MAG: hypothetical protein WB755_14305, partial [Terriglobales bacterium]